MVRINGIDRLDRGHSLRDYLAIEANTHGLRGEAYLEIAPSRPFWWELGNISSLTFWQLTKIDFVGGVAMTSGFFAIQMTNLAVANTLMFTMPMFEPLPSALCPGAEPFTRRCPDRWTGILSYFIVGKPWTRFDFAITTTSLVGVLLVASPWGNGGYTGRHPLGTCLMRFISRGISPRMPGLITGGDRIATRVQSHTRVPRIRCCFKFRGHEFIGGTSCPQSNAGRKCGGHDFLRHDLYILLRGFFFLGDTSVQPRRLWCHTMGSAE